MSILVLTKPAPNEPLVLIPGFMADARSFMPQIAKLGADRPVILLTPGLGDTQETIVAEEFFLHWQSDCTTDIKVNPRRPVRLAIYIVSQ